MAIQNQEIKKEVAILSSRLQSTRGEIEHFDTRSFSDPRDKALSFCYRRAIDLATGCELTANAQLPDSLQSLVRSLFEVVFQAAWIAQSEQNAITFADAGLNDLKRNARAILRAGHAKVVTRDTGEDKSQEFLTSSTMSNVGGLLRFDAMAREAGLERLYIQLYGLSSAFAHGYSFGILEPQNLEGFVFGTIAAASASFACIRLITKNWIEDRKFTDASDIYRVLET